MPGSRASATLVHESGGCQRADFCTTGTDTTFAIASEVLGQRFGRAVTAFVTPGEYRMI
jgi:hypothetical protein